MKTCFTCKIEKDFEHFHKKGSRYKSSCKSCCKEYHREHYENNKDSYKTKAKVWRENNPHRVIATRYRVDQAVVEGIMSVGECEICSSTEKLVFDHIHEDGRPRGCLCTSCNILLGRLGDTNEQIRSRMKDVQDYLSKREL